MKNNKHSFFSLLRMTGRQYAVFIILCCMGVSLAAFAYTTLKGLEQDKMNTEMRRITENLVNALQETVDDNLDKVVSLESFYLSSENVTRDEFAVFSQSIMRHEKGINVLEWIQYVTRQERRIFEERARQSGIAYFSITERQEQGVMVPASERDVYFPVYYVEPFEGNENALGFDLGSNLTRLKALESSRDTGSMKATSPVMLVQDKDKQVAVLAFLPIYRKDILTNTLTERREKLKGFVLGVFRIEDLVEDALSTISPQRIDLYFYEKHSGDVGDAFIYYRPSRARSGDKPAALDKNGLMESNHYVLPVEIADKSWQVYGVPTPAFYAVRETWQVWGIPSIILLFTGLLLGYMVVIFDRVVQIRSYAHDLSLAKDVLEQEVSVRQQAENSLRESQERYRGFVQNFSGIAYRGDLKTSAPIFFHGAVEKVTGYRAEEFMQGKHSWGQTIFPDDVTRILNDDRMKSLPNYTYDREYRIVCKDGGIRWVNEVGRNICDSLGVPRYFEGIIYDITRRRKLEEDMQRSRKVESIGVLAGGIAHDFNNILTAIVGNISIAKMTMNKEERNHKLLQAAEKASMRAKDLTQQLLTFSKGGEPVKQLAEISEVIIDSADFVVRGTKVRCDYHFAPDLWPAEIDRGQISQVIQNIVLNASHAMPEGGVVKILCSNFVWDENQQFSHQLGAKFLDAGEYIIITIKNTGIGIPAEIIDRIFDPYFSTKNEGSGLGLAICHSIIKNHQGRISVKSDSDETAFSIYLPASKSQPATASEDEVESQSPKNARILIMDDQELVRETLGSMLTHLGHVSIMAVDGKEAVEQYRNSLASQNSVDLIIMDLTIPGGMGGEEAVKAILNIDPEARVIVSSGYSNNPVMANYSQYGFRSAVVKPYKLEEVRRAINQALS